MEIDQPSSPSTPSSLPVLADMIQVTGDLPDIDLLMLYFEGVNSGGGEEKEVEWIKTIKEGVVHIKFANKEGEKELTKGMACNLTCICIFFLSQMQH